MVGLTWSKKSGGTRKCIPEARDTPIRIPQRSSIDRHALSVLEKANSSGYWPPSKRKQRSGEDHGKYEINTALRL
jgi:hypothetical protein